MLSMRIIRLKFNQRKNTVDIFLHFRLIRLVVFIDDSNVVETCSIFSSTLTFFLPFFLLFWDRHLSRSTDCWVSHSQSLNQPAFVMCTQPTAVGRNTLVLPLLSK